VESPAPATQSADPEPDAAQPGTAPTTPQQPEPDPDAAQPGTEPTPDVNP